MNSEKMTGKRSIYWRRVRFFTLMLITVWFVVTFGIIFFARELSTFTFFGWPFSFYMAAQGLTLMYVVIVFIYAKHMRRLDKTLENGDADAH
ncbi:MAG TPA: DUF4212 domain-containing protein [Noviherbaspirillum sp.]